MKKVTEDNMDLAVFYADNSQWKGHPSWVKDDQLLQWEVYLDKENPEDFSFYELIRPDIVFIVTPDFMHSQTAEYLGRQSTPHLC